MRGRPSLLLVYMGLATCLDTSPHREQNQGECLSLFKFEGECLEKSLAEV